MIKIISTYQISVWIIAQFMFIRLFIKYLFIDNKSIGLIFLLIIMIFSIFFIFSNICLLFNFQKQYFNKFLNLNIWTNFFQIFHLSLVGFTYYFEIGPQISPYYSYDNNWDISIALSPFESSFGLKYFDSNLILAGISLIPLIIYILLNRIKKTPAPVGVPPTSNNLTDVGCVTNE
jgi:hypothetical protein